jgi:hypothetical protein
VVQKREYVNAFNNVPEIPIYRGLRVPPTDTLRKDSTLPPVTSKKSIVFLGMMEIAGFFQGLNIPALAVDSATLQAGSGTGCRRSLQKGLPSLFEVKKMVRLWKALDMIEKIFEGPSIKGVYQMIQSL